MREYKALIVDKHNDVRTRLEQIFSVWNFAIETTDDASVIAQTLKHAFYDLIVVDFETPKTKWPALLSEISAFSPDSRIIVLARDESSCNDIKALSLQLCAVIKTPPEVDALLQAVKKVCDDQRVSFEKKEILNALRHNRQKLDASSVQLKRLNEQVSTLKNDIAELIGTRELDPVRQEKQIHQKIRSLILSITNELKKSGTMKEYESQLKLLESYTEELCSNIAKDLEGSSSLSLTELRVVSMVRTGLTTAAIASLLHISPDTVKTHRRNIRRKLHIVGTKSDLAAYLQSASKPLSKRMQPQVQSSNKSNVAAIKRNRSDPCPPLQ